MELMLLHFGQYSCGGVACDCAGRATWEPVAVRWLLLMLLLLLIVLCLYILVEILVVVVVVAPISRRPSHLVLLLQPAPGVCKPSAHLRQRHARHHGQKDLLVFGRVGVRFVLGEPALQEKGILSGGILASWLHWRQLVLS